MSYQLLKQDVLFYQRFLKSNGLYNGLLDGVWGSETNKADAEFISQSISIAKQYGSFDSRSESNIVTLVPKAQIEARMFLKRCRGNDKDVRIISGTRTYQEQNVLYNHGRFGNPAPVVTNAKGGQSNHNFGIAWDVGLFDNDGNYITHDTDYVSLAKIILPEIKSIEWGGNWHFFKDYPHYQLKAVSESVTIIRRLFEDGNIYV